MFFLTCLTRKGGIRRATRADFIHNGGFHEAVGPLLVIAQCFCLMPVRGILAATPKGLSFRWKCFRTWYCILYILATIADTGLTINMVVKGVLDVRNIEPLIFHANILLASFGFLRLAAKWPQLMRKWQRVERQLPPHQSWRDREALSVRVHKVMPESYWTRTRLQYRLICELIEQVDASISGLTMLSFANNLYFVCIQLLKSMNTMPSVAHFVYFYASLSFLLGRTLAVSLYLSEVNDRSRKPLRIIKLIPKEGYHPEVDRLCHEIGMDTIALTGLQYFNVTRGLVLTVAGTIVTYELVLIQFHEDQNLWNCN
ncbi:gustatory receptor 5a for trehalose-like isoform X2 [Ceratitis capitata]|uniref:gustatory receptor 5a for trehalose-like isoform X2 n=1 Tax=Ceratitis capitata TaxID=7213 RepID=UPI000A1144DD|nr:gustatory receptor 5a for trehalose-like isoform X2 [Ceratitis capitata]